MSLQTLRASKCGLSANSLSPAVLDVIDNLTKAGYDAYVVGGCVRDLLLNQRPKDFDAVTNATPSQIKQVFGKRCRIIGRRFELAHVYSGRELIEVATFRAPPEKAITNASGMVLRDNVWGSIEQDFARRDFSVNALYYQPRKGVILDFCNGYDDLRQGRLRLLGDALQRFEEDPVRMLRALRFTAKLSFDMDASIKTILKAPLTTLLRDVSPHRLYDESQKMLSVGKLAELLPLLIQYDVWKPLFADIEPKITPFMQRAAENTDNRIHEGNTINPAFFYAVFLWDCYLQRVEVHLSRQLAPHQARLQAGIDVLKRQSLRTAIPRFAETFIREVWEMQARLVQPKPGQIPTLSAHVRFRAGYDFLLLREQSGDTETCGMGSWWHQYQKLSSDEKEKAIAKFQRDRIRQRRKKAKPIANESSHAEGQNAANFVEPLLGKAHAEKEQARAQRMKNKREHSQPDHRPILKRKRLKRDLSTVVFGPTQ